jgi:hypothetical protein
VLAATADPDPEVGGGLVGGGDVAGALSVGVGVGVGLAGVDGATWRDGGADVVGAGCDVLRTYVAAGAGTTLCPLAGRAGWFAPGEVDGTVTRAGDGLPSEPATAK